MDNLLKQTEDVLRENGQTFKDVLWCGTKKESMSLERFKELANFSYDGGFGGQEIATDLLVVGADFWLERHEYDGSEWWEFKRTPVKPSIEFKGDKLGNVDSWSTLEEVNRYGGKYAELQSKEGERMKILEAILFVVILVLAGIIISGCTSTYNCPKGKITICTGENTENVECEYVNE